MKKKTNISLDKQIEELARHIMAARCFTNFSGLIEQLIREEFERRNGPAKIDPPIPTPKFDAGGPAYAQYLQDLQQLRNQAQPSTPMALNETSSVVDQAATRILKAAVQDVKDEMGPAALAAPVPQPVATYRRAAKSPRAKDRKGPA